MISFIFYMKAPVLVFFLVFSPYINEVFPQNGNGLEITYRKNITLDQEVISGGYFVDPPKEYEGHPYFITRNFESSEITINGLNYKGVPLLYNIWEDQVLTFHPIHKQKILIRSDKINAFTLQLDTSVSFVRLEDNPSYSHHGSGIYESLGDGPARLLIKHRKLTRSKREVSIFSKEFYEEQDYFLKKNGEILKVANRKQAIDFLALEKKAVKRLSRASNLYFRTDKKDYLSLLVELYNQAQDEKK